MGEAIKQITASILFSTCNLTNNYRVGFDVFDSETYYFPLVFRQFPLFPALVFTSLFVLQSEAICCSFLSPILFGFFLFVRVWCFLTFLVFHLQTQFQLPTEDSLQGWDVRKLGFAMLTGKVWEAAEQTPKLFA